MGIRGLAWIAAAALFAGAAPDAVAGPAEDGQQALRAGVALLQDPGGPKYDEAIPLLRQAYELTKSWRILGNLGLCLTKLERIGEAAAIYQRFLADGGSEIDQAERAQIEREIASIRQQAATMALTVSAQKPLRIRDERVKPNGQRVVNTYDAPETNIVLDVMPGEHVFFALQGSKEPRWAIALQPGQKVSHEFGPADAGESELPTRSSTPIIVAGTITAGLAAATAITGVMALRKRDDFDAINGRPGHGEQELLAAHDEADHLGLISSMLFGTALVSAGITTWLVLRPTKPASGAIGSASPWVGPNAFGLSIRGQL
jgi:hypothetical protein